MNLFFSKSASIEPIITENLRPFVDRNAIIFDLGANIGYYTLLFSDWASAGKVVAVEPDPDNHVILQTNVLRNERTNVCIVRKAASDSVGNATMYQDRNTGRTSSLIQEVFHPAGIHVPKTFTVPITSVDALSREFGIPSVIKCDVEGAEIDVMKGSGEVLRAQPVLMIEVGPTTAASICKLLSDHDYLLFDAEKPLPSAPVGLFEFPTNILAVPRNRFVERAP